MSRDTRDRSRLGLRCFSCQEEHDPAQLNNVCRVCGMPLEISVPLPKGTPEDLIDTALESMWRYGTVLPIPADRAVSLGEGWTPLLDLGDGVWVKDESVNPTASFKDRGMSMAISAAVSLGAEGFAAPSAGNAGVALAAYGARAGLPVMVAMPEDTPLRMIERCREYGAHVESVAGTIGDAGKWLAEHGNPQHFDVSTLKEPYRVEGKKTMGYELYEQFQGELPDVVIYPTGGGTGLVGMWKAWNEMEAMGWLDGKAPRMVSVQAEGCAPVVSAFLRGETKTVPFPSPETKAYGLRVPSPIGGFLCLRAIAETGGTALTVTEAEIEAATSVAADLTGIDFCPEGGAAWAGWQRLRADGWITDSDRVVVWNTGSGRMYSEDVS